MKRIFTWQVTAGIILIALSAGLFELHYRIFGDSKYILMYILAALAFVFVEVLLVTLVINNLMTYREKKSMLNKMNMVIGAFYSEAGTELMKMLCALDGGSPKISGKLLIMDSWDDKKFLDTKAQIGRYQSAIVCGGEEAEKLKKFLVGKRGFLLRLLENPNLLEHDTFTNLLWAVFHMTEELERRPDLRRASDKDLAHLVNDMKRAYGLLVSEWLAYTKHLKTDYPYLFSLAVRTNPFDARASAEIK